jgi:EmrB/QacA subfamily drug resistance transporter
MAASQPRYRLPAPAITGGKVSCILASDSVGTSQKETVPELSRRRRLLVLGICCLSLFIVGLDSTIVNVALPAIGRDLQAPVSGLQWTVDAYTLVLASLLMLSGSTADRVGRRRTFQAGLVTFTIGSLLCSLAPGLGWLVAFRMVQAVGGSMLNPVAMSIITNTFPSPAERARAIGVWGATFGLSLALGPVLGGVLVQTVGWRGIFWVNIPVGLAAIVLSALFVPESRAARPRRPDPAGQVLIIVCLASLTYAIIEGPDRGWSSPLILSLFGLAAVMLAALLAYEPRRREPLLDLRFFRSAPFSGAAGIAVCAFAALGAFLFLNTIYLQDVRGLSALRAGLYLLPMAAMTALLSPVAGRIISVRGPRLPLLVGGTAMMAGGAMLTGLSAATPGAWLLAAYVIFGIGNGMANPPITATAVAGMPRAQAGVAAGLASTSRQIGTSLGVAVAGSAATSALHGSLRAGFAQASHAGWWMVAGCGAAVLVLGLVTSGRWARRTADRTASRLIADGEPAAAIPSRLARVPAAAVSHCQDPC